MAVIETQFSIGDVVYKAGITTVSKQHPCPDCKGSRKWTAISPAGGEYQFSCPRCSANFHGDDALSLRYAAHEATVQRLTIGSVRTDSSSGRGNEYMCVETGIGSGSLYYEADLFETYDEAEAVAKAKAGKADVEVEWVAKLYDRSIKLCDYELSNAEREANKRRISEWREQNIQFWNDVEWASSVDEIKDLVEKYRGQE